MKSNKKKRIKELESQVATLTNTLNGFMEFVGYHGQIYESVIEEFKMEPISEFTDRLRETEAKYALKSA